MARSQEAETNTATEGAATEGAATAAPAATTTSGSDERYIKTTLDQEAVDKFYAGSDKKPGDTVNRADFIRTAWKSRTVDRGGIRKEINRLNKATGQKEIPYQIVFQATKGHEGGPVAAPAAPAAEGAAAAE